MEDKCDDSINLRTLRHIDESIDEILLFGGQVAVYKYSFQINEWERKEIEGSMFVIKRNKCPNHAFVVINRLNTTNMFQTIAHNLDTKLQVPYLLYKNANNEIFCIWFYNEMDCVNVGNKLDEIIHKLSSETIQLHAMSGEHKANTLSNTPSNNDIFKRLLSVDLNSSDADKLQKTSVTSNGQNSKPTQTPTPAQPQRRTLNVQDLFESQMATLSITSKPVISQEPNQQNFDECLLNDVITPAMLTDQSSKALKPIHNHNHNESANTLIPSQKISQSPIIFGQQSQPILSTTAFGQNYMSLVGNTDRSGPIQSLTMEQLKQTLIYLLQNDADFLHSIHTAYASSLNRK